jgi:signal transduction histidine kinase
MSWFGALPLTVRVPAVVALLMIAVSVTVSEHVLSRLNETQERHLRALGGAYMDGLSSSLVPHVLRGDVWEVFDVLDRARDRYEALRPIETVVTGSDGRIVAATDPTKAPTLSTLPVEFSDRFGTSDIAIDSSEDRAYARRVLAHQGQTIGAIYAAFDISHLSAERANVMRTLLFSNGLLTLLLAGIGYFATRRMVMPMRILGEHLRNSLDSVPEPIPVSKLPRSGSEARRLFDSFNTLVRAEREREDLTLKLAEEERLASLGRLASGMAHEINNPLGGLFNALDTIKRHGETASVRETAVSLVERGLHGIRDVVAAALHTYRPDRSPRPFGPSDIEDLGLLIRPELRRRHLDLQWDNDLRDPVDVPNAPLRQAVLNLLLNACNAAPDNGTVGLRVVRSEAGLTIEISDTGEGLPENAIGILTDPASPAPIGTGSGLGLWMVHRSVTEIGGIIDVDRSILGGTLVRLQIPVQSLPLDHGVRTDDAA